MNLNKPWKKAILFPLCTREEYAGGCPAATQRPIRSQRGTEGNFRLGVSFLLLTLASLLPTAQAGELGRLFFTPQQRQHLEFQESSNSSEDSAGRRNYIVVNGIVQKHGGKRTVWVNGTAQPAESSNDQSPGVAPVTIPGKSRPVRLKVGQRLMLDTAAPEQNQEPEANK
jgi:hypothetical protein